METLEAIMGRRSVPRMTDRLPERSQVERLLQAAVRAPNHHLTEPWRFIVLTGAALDALGEAWARGEARRGKDPEPIKSKPRRAPVIICVVARPRVGLPKVLEVEELFAVGAAMQNLLLAARDVGLGTMLRTGRATEFEEVRAHLGVAEDEVIAGFIYVGYPPPEDDRRPRSRRTDPDRLTEWRGWGNS